MHGDALALNGILPGLIFCQVRLMDILLSYLSVIAVICFIGIHCMTMVRMNDDPLLYYNDGDESWPIIVR